MKRLLIILLFPLMMFAQDSTLIGDVDCSGEVNSQDASLILQFVTNVIDELPCQDNMTGLTPEQLQEMIDMMDEQLSINYTGGSGGGFDWQYPQGTNGESVVFNFENGSYTVPEDMNLYITQLYTFNSSNFDPLQVEINDIVITSSFFAKSFWDGSSYRHGSVLNNPLVLKENDIIEYLGTYGGFVGFLVNKSTNLEPMTLHLWNGTYDNYIVPENKKFVILNIRQADISQELKIDNVGVLSGMFNSNQPLSQPAMFGMVLSSPIILSSGHELSSSSQTQINGYLVDEDYFSSAGAGANSGNSSQSDMYLECVDMGVSILCGSLGLDPSVSLDPQDGYYYSLSNSDYLNSENYIQYPHWRKFKIGGLGDNLVENGQLMFKYEHSNGTSSVKFLTPEVVDGEVYFYLYQTYQNFGQGCVSAENIGLSIPLEHSWLVSYYSGSSGGNWSGGSLTKFEIYYQSNGSYKSAGLLFSWN